MNTTRCLLKSLATVIAFSCWATIFTAAQGFATPSAPQNLAATVASPTSVILTWDPPPTSEDVSFYRIYRNGQWIDTTNTSGEKYTYAITGLTASTSYSFHVVAYDTSGNAGASPLPVPIRTLAVERGPATYYVDSSLTADITDGRYSITNRNNTGSDGNAYKTVQSAIFAMNPGDTIYLRNGVYTAAYSPNHSFYIPTRKCGSAANWSSIQSYPGEWAVLQGDPKSRIVIGLDDGSGTTYLRYWRFDRLEICDGAGVGISVSGGPVQITRCYIHSNRSQDAEVFNGEGILGYVLMDSLIENCYFVNNGSLPRNLGIKLVADYHYSLGTAYDNPSDHSRYLGNVTIRNNLFEGSLDQDEVAINFKAKQYLTSYTTVNWSHGDWGAKIYNNIMLNQTMAIGVNQDFAQIHHNIITSQSGTGIQIAEGGSIAGMNAVTVYNNTILGGKILTWWSPLTLPRDDLKTPYLYIFNNLIDSSPSDDNHSISLRKEDSRYEVQQSRVEIARNYIYRALPKGTGPIYHLFYMKFESFPSGAMRVEDYQAAYGSVNYARDVENAADPLYQGATGAARFLPNAGHVMQGSATIGSGGRGGDHPYLPGVKIPSYIGAVDPASPGWVADVLALSTIGSAGDQVAPTGPTGLTAVPTNEVTVNLAWNPSTDNLCVAGYRLYRDGALIAKVMAPLYTDIGLDPSRSYTYTVQAFDVAANRSALSAGVTITTPVRTDFTAPTQPQNLTVAAQTSFQARITWHASTDLPAIGATGLKYYRIYRNGLLVQTTSGISFVESTLDPAVTYTYQVSAVDYVGNESVLSAPATVVLPPQLVLYVDPLPAEAGSGWDGVDGTLYQGAMGMGAGYGTVQAALDAMAPGDDIYLRGGVYTGSYSPTYAFKIPVDKSGGVSNWSSIQSYPGEWAILQGNGVAQNVIGLTDGSGTTPIHHWAFERLELRNGKVAGLNVTGGPFRVRYCYFHGNRSLDTDVFRAGLIGYVLRDSVIEYCYFRDNGNMNRNLGCKLIADYKHHLGDDFEHPLNPGSCERNTAIRYCVFEGDTERSTDIAIGFKALQFLTPHTDVDWSHSDWGNKIHHNIFLDNTLGVGCLQDFTQIYNNIFKSRDTAVEVNQSGKMVDVTGATVYNNTIIGGKIVSYWSLFTFRPWSTQTPYYYLYNNIVDQAPSTSGDLSISVRKENPGYEVRLDRLGIANNYIHCAQPFGSNTYHMLFLAASDPVPKGGAMRVEDFQAAYGFVNRARDIEDPADRLFPAGATGAAALIARSNHNMSAGAMIGTGGRGGSHPFLPGVSIPTYVGATNPNDNAWVAGVLNLKTITNLQSAGPGDPSWIEGGIPSTYSTWRSANFGADAANDAISGPNADPDGSGISNLQRYAFGLAARGPVAAPTTLGTATSGGQSFLTITFNRRVAATDLSYNVESSTDLIIWTPVPGLLYAPGDGPITAQDTVAMGTAGPRRFLRVKITAP